MTATQEQVTQADRDAAAAFFDPLERSNAHEALSQAFARHRLAHTEPQDASRPSEGLTEAMKALLNWAEIQVCPHEETHRGGTLWEICSMCGAKWADDEGGKPDFKWPKPILNARAALRTQEARPEAVGMSERWAIIGSIYAGMEAAIEKGGRTYAHCPTFDDAKVLQHALSEQPRTDAALPSDIARMIDDLRTHAFDDCGGKHRPTHIANLAADMLARLARTDAPDLRELLKAAYFQGAKDVHDEWIKLDLDGGLLDDPDFGEAAHDYAASIRIDQELGEGR